MLNNEFEFAVVFILGFAVAFGIGYYLIQHSKAFSKFSDWMFK